MTPFIDKLAVIPAAGKASRMRGLPKFCLPCDLESTTLIERHVFSCIESHDKTVIAVRPGNLDIIGTLSLPPEVGIIEIETDTMSETVLKIASMYESKLLSVFMPDTYFLGE